MRQSRGVVNPAELRVNNPVAAVSDKRMAALGLSYCQRGGLLNTPYHRLYGSLDGGDTKRNDLDRQRKSAKRVDVLALVSNNDHAPRSCSDDFFPQQGAAAPFYQRKIWRDFISAVYCQIEMRYVIKCGQHNAAAFCVGQCRFRRGHSNDIKSVANPFADQFDK